VLDPRLHEVTLVNAGHLPPLWRRGPGQIAPISDAGADLPLGIERNVDYPHRTLSLSGGDCLILYTDGITEAMNARDELYGFGRLSAVLNSDVGDVPQLGRRILDDVKRFVGPRAQSDDLCLVCFGRRE
jgi:phosphoserine phosphatase RsbU/P